MFFNKTMALKVGVFYDGSYFTHVSNYYNYVHPHRRRIHIGGLHDYIRHMVGEREGTHPNLCHIIDVHFFRGRFSAKDANEKPNQLYYDRVFDDVLMYNGVQTHYLPVKDVHGRKREKGIDVLMALETYELCMLKRYDIVVMIASDGDHVTLVRKLHALGCKTMLLGWDFEFTDEESGEVQVTKTSTDLWNEVSYPMPMHELIDEGLRDSDAVVRELFVLRESVMHEEPEKDEAVTSVDEEKWHKSTIFSVFKGYGFIKFSNNNVFFLAADFEGNFNDLEEGDEVEFQMYINEKGKQQARTVRLL